jgi:hypothetical protein
MQVGIEKKYFAFCYYRRRIYSSQFYRPTLSSYISARVSDVPPLYLDLMRRADPPKLVAWMIRLETVGLFVTVVALIAFVTSRSTLAAYRNAVDTK